MLSALPVTGLWDAGGFFRGIAAGRSPIALVFPSARRRVGLSRNRAYPGRDVNDRTKHNPCPKRASPRVAGAPPAACVGCGGSRVVPLMTFPDVPTQATMVLRDEASARSFPRATMEIGYCESCGLICNTAFDASALRYGEGFEESQFGSSTFRAYADDLAARLARETEGVAGHLVELGCGKGEFLERLCERSGTDAIGIDPACDPSRIRRDLEGRITIDRRFYGDEHAEMIRGAAMVCCRHTLEHLGDPLAFLRLLRSHLEGRPETLVYFDVPDTDHVIDDGAFWEMNYEHCAYYTPPSLVRLFERAGFSVLEVGVEYGGQNLFIKATSGAVKTPPDVPPVGAARARAIAFAENTERAISRWSAALSGRGGTALWGSGSRAVGFMGATGLGEQEIGAVVDISPRRQGMYMPGYGRPIVGPGELASIRPDRVIVMNPIYTEEIRSELARVGLAVDVHRVNSPPD